MALQFGIHFLFLSVLASQPLACVVVLILKSYKEYKVGAMLVEQKIESVKGIHPPHDTLYIVLLRNGLIIENMEKK